MSIVCRSDQIFGQPRIKTGHRTQTCTFDWWLAETAADRDHSCTPDFEKQAQEIWAGGSGYSYRLGRIAVQAEESFDLTMPVDRNYKRTLWCDLSKSMLSLLITREVFNRKCKNTSRRFNLSARLVPYRGSLGDDRCLWTEIHFANLRQSHTQINAIWVASQSRRFRLPRCITDRSFSR
jgi:hypothetical protein